MKKLFFLIAMCACSFVCISRLSAQIYEIDSFVNKYAKAYDELVANTYKERADINYKDEYIEIPNGTEVTVKRIISVSMLKSFMRGRQNTFMPGT